MQFQTTLISRIPRCSSEECGVKTTSVPWADQDSRFTLLFEAFAVDVEVRQARIDEKSFAKGHGLLHGYVAGLRSDHGGRRPECPNRARPLSYLEVSERREE